jgi:hypothetical protein
MSALELDKDRDRQTHRLILSQVLAYEVQLTVDSFPLLAWKSLVIPANSTRGNAASVTISYTSREARTFRWARAKVGSSLE